MGKFKQFLKKKLIKSESRPQTDTIGFATIHGADDSDKLLKVNLASPSQKQELQKEDNQQNIYHAAFLASNKERATNLHKSSNEEFHHHLALNIKHLKTGKRIEMFPYDANPQPAIKQYTYSSKGLNQHLIEHGPKFRKSPPRGVEKDDFREPYWNNIHKHLSKETNHPANALKKPTIVHSGVGTKMATILKQTKVGQHIHFPAYTSTTTDAGFAKSFGKPAIDEEGDEEGYENTYHTHVVHFHLPKGYRKGRYVENISSIKGENEMILHHGQSFRKVAEHHEIIPGVPGEYQRSHHIHHHHHLVPVD